MTLSRREFFKTAAGLAAALSCPVERRAAATGLGQLTTLDIESGLQWLDSGQAPVLWLQGQSCSGCSVSFLNAAYPDAAAVITQYISLDFHQTISAATGDVARNAMEARIQAGGYILVVEGSVPAGLPAACRIAEEPFADLLLRAARPATAVVCVGSCASMGGIPAAASNPTGATAAGRYLKSKGLTVPIVNLPGCPIHPDWLVGTLVHVLKAGLPELDEQGRPRLFYGSVIHTRCPQFYNYSIGRFATQFGEDGCLFQLGCQGIRTYADCSSRGWNTNTNWCIGARAPCIGCARPEFALDPAYPFYRLREKKL